MAWPEKVALGLLATIALGILFFASTGQPEPGIHQATGLAWWGLFASGMWIVARNAVLPIWLFLRPIDLLTGGPARRGSRHPQPPPAEADIIPPGNTSTRKRQPRSIGKSFSDRAAFAVALALVILRFALDIALIPFRFIIAVPKILAPFIVPAFWLALATPRILAGLIVPLFGIAAAVLLINGVSYLFGAL